MKNIAAKALAIGLITVCTGCAENERLNLVTGTRENPTVISPDCPNWTDPEESSNFSCANITNFGLMIENPNDMIIGQSNNLTNGARSGLPVSTYESGPSSATTSTSTSSSGSSAAH